LERILSLGELLLEQNVLTTGLTGKKTIFGERSQEIILESEYF
jgi:hypothetical protein